MRKKILKIKERKYFPQVAIDVGQKKALNLIWKIILKY